MTVTINGKEIGDKDHSIQIRLRSEISPGSCGQHLIVSVAIDGGKEIDVIREWGLHNDMTIDHWSTQKMVDIMELGKHKSEMRKSYYIDVGELDSQKQKSL